jgi:hypothetical protein
MVFLKGLTNCEEKSLQIGAAAGCHCRLAQSSDPYGLSPQRKDESAAICSGATDVFCASRDSSVLAALLLFRPFFR